MDQELYCIQRGHDITRARWASGQPADAAACARWRTSSPPPGKYKT